MAKKKFFCTECKNFHSQWSGTCNYCNNWNTIFEYKCKPMNNGFKSRDSSYINSDDLKNCNSHFKKTGFNDFDTVIGGGIVDGTVMILSGGPGVGKSTLLLKVVSGFSKINDQFSLYCSGEESILQIGQRIKRLNLTNSKLLLLDCYDLNDILFNIHESNSKLVVIDSLQMIRDSENNINGYSHSSLKLLIDQIVEFSKKNDVCFILINQVVKDGNLAGPKYVEHMVDMVLDLKRSKPNERQIILKSTKNRFGPIEKQSLLEYSSKGDLISGSCSEILDNSCPAGRAFGVYFKNQNPFFYYVDVLMSKNKNSSGKRVSNHINRSNFELIIAVMEKIFRISLENIDIYLSIYGPYDGEEDSMLTITAGILSCFRGKQLNRRQLFFGDFDMHGEINNNNDFLSGLDTGNLPLDYTLVSSFKRKISSRIKLNHMTNIGELDQLFKNNND